MTATETNDYRLMCDTPEEKERGEVKQLPSFFAYLREPWGSLGKHELESEAYLYAKALSISGDRWREMPLSEARALIPEIANWSPKGSAASAWESNPLTLERALYIWRRDV